jgi:hypothetical protein
MSDAAYELLQGLLLQRRVEAAFEADGGGGFGAHAGTARRAGEVAWIDLDCVVEPQQPLEQTVVKFRREVLGSLFAGKIWPADAANKQRVPGQHEPGILATSPVADEIADAFGGVSRCVEHADVVVAELHLVAVAQLRMREEHVRRFVEIDASPRALGERLGGRRMIGLDVGLEDVADGTARELGELQVLVEVVQVRVAHGELTLALSAEEVGGAAGGGVKNLAKDHDAHLPTDQFGPVLVGRPAAAHSG